MVALQLVADIDQEFIPIFASEFCNSSYGVRPIQLWISKENNETTKIETDRVRAEVRSMKDYNLTNDITVKFRGFAAMCDGKVSICIRTLSIV